MRDKSPSLPAHSIIEVSPEWSERFRAFCQISSQTAYVRPEAGITPDLLSKEAFDRPEVIAYFTPMIAATTTTRAWMAIDANQEIIGTVAARRQGDHSVLSSLYVKPELQGLGLAHELFDRVKAFAGGLPLRLDVVEFMRDSIAIYEHWGFVIDEAAGRPRWIWQWWPEQALEALRGIYMVRPGQPDL